jgi:hypothetical protein
MRRAAGKKYKPRGQPQTAPREDRIAARSRTAKDRQSQTFLSLLGRFERLVHSGRGLRNGVSIRDFQSGRRPFVQRAITD